MINWAQFFFDNKLTRLPHLTELVELFDNCRTVTAGTTTATATVTATMTGQDPLTGVTPICHPTKNIAYNEVIPENK